MTNKVNVNSVTVDGVAMVEIKIGRSKAIIPVDRARQLAQVIENYAAMPAVMNHIDNVFNFWTGDEGGTC